MAQRCGIPAILIASLVLGTARLAADDPLAVVARFAERFLAGRHEENLASMTPEMQAASGPEASAALRAQLAEQNGELRATGEPWYEDRVSVYRRYRVPVRFERVELDFRIVLDAEGRVAGFFLVPHREPPAPEADAADPREVPLQVGEAERALPGLLTVPAGEGPFPGVVLVHGSGPLDRDETVGPNKPFRDLARGLADHGIASLRYDKRSLARPLDLLAAGLDLTVKEEAVDDARAALRAIAARPEIDAQRVFVLGHSLGGTLAPRIAEPAPRPAGLIVLAGMTLPLPEKMATQTRYIVELDGRVSGEEAERLRTVESAVHSIRAALDGEGPAPEGALLGAPIGYYRDLAAHDPPAEAARLGLPILVLQGGRDYQVTLEDLALWRAALADKPFACLATYADLDHLFRAGSGPSGPADYERAAPVAPRVITDIAEWIRSRSCPPS